MKDRPEAAALGPGPPKKPSNQQLNLARLAGSRKPCTINLITENAIEGAVIFAFDTFTISILLENKRPGVKTLYRTLMIMKHAIISIEEEIEGELALKLKTPKPREPK